MTEVFPTGAPDPSKKGDSVATNTISRIAAIKQNEKQVDRDKPFVLWLDLQDPGVVWGFPIAEELFSTLFTEAREGIAGCGPFWYALYGHKGDLLLESKGIPIREQPSAARRSVLPDDEKPWRTVSRVRRRLLDASVGRHDGKSERGSSSPRSCACGFFEGAGLSGSICLSWTGDRGSPA